MISATVVGNVGKDAVINQTKDGSDVLSFSLACNRKRYGEDETLWVRCSLYGRRAKPLAQYIVKGCKVAVSGRLWADTSESNGRTFLNVDMDVDSVELCYIPDRDNQVAGQGQYGDEIPF